METQAWWVPVRLWPRRVLDPASLSFCSPGTCHTSPGRPRGCQLLTQGDECLVVLLHHVPVQRPLSRPQELPLLLREPHSQVMEGNGHLWAQSQGSWLVPSQRGQVSPGSAKQQARGERPAKEWQESAQDTVMGADHVSKEIS